MSQLLIIMRLFLVMHKIYMPKPDSKLLFKSPFKSLKFQPLHVISGVEYDHLYASAVLNKKEPGICN